MALVVVASFLDLTEANIAAGALRAAGLHPEVADQHAGAVMSIQQLALQGFRLSVRDDEVADARMILAEAQARSRPRYGPPERADANLWRLMAVVLSLVLSPAIGWLAVIGLRSNRTHGHVPLALALSVGAIVAVLALDVALQRWPALGPVVILLGIGAVIAGIGRFMRAAVEKADTEPLPPSHSGLGDE